jgi:Mn-dependent DtxR family transcriptional regulator
MILDPYDRVILETLYRTRRELNTNEIAKEMSVQWITAKRHLDKLRRLRYVKPKENGDVTYWELVR